MRSNRHCTSRFSSRDTASPAPTRRRHRFVYWVVLIVYSAFLLGRALWSNRVGDDAYMPLWELQDSHRLLAWLGRVALAGIGELALFAGMGFLAALAVPCPWRLLRRLPINIGALVLADVVAILTFAVETWPAEHLGIVVSLIPPLVGCLFGVWLGTMWGRGRRARLWLLPKVALLFFLLALGAGLMLWLSIEDESLPFDPATVTSARKRELVRRIRSKSPRSLKDGQTHTLRLTEQDVNMLLAWGLSLGSSHRKAHVEFAPAFASLGISLGLARGERKPHYLNVRVVGDLQITRGQLDLRIDGLRLGRVWVPVWLVKPWGPVIASTLNHDRRSKPILEAIETAAIGQDWIEATYGCVELPPGFREDLFGPSTAGEKLLAATRAQAEHLLASFEGWPRGQRPPLEMCFQTAFALARDRSVLGDPVTENRAAIFALGTLLGHERLEHFLGPVIPNQGYRTARRALYRVTLRERTDWTRHFCLSAALALLSDAAVSDAAGLLKEELDADVGGSGFSFADLLADRAGTTFAIQATRDGTAAMAMQNRLADGFQIDDIFPSAADLPEGIPDAELQSQYGGVGGEAYRRLTEEIERRIRACSFYR